MMEAEGIVQTVPVKGYSVCSWRSQQINPGRGGFPLWQLFAKVEIAARMGTPG